MSSTETGLLTYTPGYGAELDNIQLNKIYSFDSIKVFINKSCQIWDKNTNKSDFVRINNSFAFKWIPKEEETQFDLDKNISIIDYMVDFDNNKKIKIIDNYGNIHISGKGGFPHMSGSFRCIEFDSSILLNKTDKEILSDQVIDYIKQNNLICLPAINTEHIKQIQNIAGMGREKTIKYVMEYPQRVVEVEYDINNIIKELVIAFPGCDPWEKAKELFEKYTDMVDTLTEEYKNDKEILGHLIHEKNNIYKMIMRNKDIDDDDLKELIAIKTSKMESAESQIEEILERNKERREKINKLNLLLCKLDATSIPEKTLTTEFI